MNALQGSGSAHGIMDHNQANGMSAQECVDILLKAEDYLSDDGKNFLQQSAKEAGLPPIENFNKPTKRDINTLYRLAYPQDNGDKKTKVGELSDAYNDARDENLIRKIKKYEGKFLLFITTNNINCYAAYRDTTTSTISPIGYYTASAGTAAILTRIPAGATCC
jgi:hypothetical protein